MYCDTGIPRIRAASAALNIVQTSNRIGCGLEDAFSETGADPAEGVLACLLQLASRTSIIPTVSPTTVRTLSDVYRFPVLVRSPMKSLLTQSRIYMASATKSMAGFKLMQATSRIDITMREAG